jgi:hypothetical protein
MKQKFARLSIQPNGKYHALAFRGTPQQIQDTYATFWQWAVTNGELNEGSDTFAFVWTTPENIVRGLTAIFQNRLLNHADKFPARFKGRKGGVYPLAKAMALKLFKSIEQDTFLNRDDVYRATKYGEYNDLTRPQYASERN